MAPCRKGGACRAHRHEHVPKPLLILVAERTGTTRGGCLKQRMWEARTPEVSAETAGVSNQAPPTSPPSQDLDAWAAWREAHDDGAEQAEEEAYDFAWDAGEEASTQGHQFWVGRHQLGGQWHFNCPGEKQTERLKVRSFDGGGDGDDVGKSARSCVRKVQVWLRCARMAPWYRARCRGGFARFGRQRIRCQEASTCCPTRPHFAERRG